jgi:thiamine biosynthesis lipoprotein
VFGNEVPLSKRARATYWTRRCAAAMGSTAEVVLGDASDDVMSWVFSEIERLEQCWSRFRQASELSALNARAGEWVPVSASMLLLLTCAADLHRETEGRFDPTVLDALERVGYDRSFELVAPDGDPVPGGGDPAPGFAFVEIDADGSRARMPRGVRLDLGGIGKGLAADLVARGAIDRGARSVFVSLGGDQRARGEPPPDGAWQVPVENPFDEARAAFVYPVVDGALVTSTRRFRVWRRGDRVYHHIIDPRSGDSAWTPVVAVVAASRDAWWAEGIAKSVMIAGVEEGVALARSTGVHAFLFLEDGTTVETRS